MVAFNDRRAPQQGVHGREALHEHIHSSDHPEIVEPSEYGANYLRDLHNLAHQDGWANHQHAEPSRASGRMTKAEVNGHLINDHEHTAGGAGNSTRNLPSAAELHSQHEALHRSGRVNHTH